MKNNHFSSYFSGANHTDLLARYIGTGRVVTCAEEILKVDSGIEENSDGEELTHTSALQTFLTPLKVKLIIC
jgi:hypothetical protein